MMAEAAPIVLEDAHGFRKADVWQTEFIRHIWITGEGRDRVKFQSFCSLRNSILLDNDGVVFVLIFVGDVVRLFSLVMT